MHNPLIEAIRDGKSNEVIIGCLERVYEPKGNSFVPTEFYCVSAFVDGKKIENILVEVQDDETTFNEAYKELTYLVKDAEKQGFNIRYSGPKTAGEKLRLTYDLRPSDLQGMKSQMNFQTRLDLDDIAILKSMKLRGKI